MSAPGDPATGLDSRPAGGHVFGVDLGGTKVRAAVAGPDDAVLAEIVEPTAHGAGAAIVGQVAALLETLCRRAGLAPDALEAAGLALPLALDPTGPNWSLANVPGLEGVDLQSAFEGALGLPVVLDNDVNCAALGEGQAGAAVGLADYAVVAIGTGIGAGIVAGGRLLRGSHGGAGEIAFLPLGSDPWASGSRPLGAYEAAVAGPAIRSRIEAALRSDRATTLRSGATLAEVAAAAAAGDGPAAALLDEEGRVIALGLAALAAVVDPAVVVLAGGVGVVAGLLEPVRAHLAALAVRPPTVVTSPLGERAPLVGALQLARDLAGTRAAQPGAAPAVLPAAGSTASLAAPAVPPAAPSAAGPSRPSPAG